MRILRVLWVTLKDVAGDLGLLMSCNLFWCGFSLPLLFLTLFLLNVNSLELAALTAMLAVLPMGPATVGLVHVTRQVADGRATKLGDFFRGMRGTWRRSWLVLGVWMAGLLLLTLNIRFYGATQSDLTVVLVTFFFFVLLIWSALLVYLFPLTLDHTSMRTIGYQALLMVMGRPLFSFGTFFLMLAVLVISLLLPFILLAVTAALLAQWSTHATLELQQEAARHHAEQRAAAGLPPMEDPDAEPDPDRRGRRGQIQPK